MGDVAELGVAVAAADALVARAIARALRRRAYRVQTFDGAEALEAFARAEGPGLVILDLDLPGGGYELMRRLRRMSTPPLMIVLTGDGDVEGAVRAMRLGAIDYLECPVSLDVLVERVDRAIDTATVQSRLQAAARAQVSRPPLGVVGESPKLRRVLKVAKQVAKAPRTSAMLVGESGVGKEVVASYIHELSTRRDGPMVRVNAAALPETMIEAELFGSVKGAYTGSERNRPGLIASADGGTLLLDELGELPISLQPKLLRAVEERAFFPVGSDAPRSVDVRFVAATNRDPKAAIDDGTLRRDLFYRLATVLIRIPPLRERPEDVLPLARHFLAVISAEHLRATPELDAGAQEALVRHAWPGNVRELRNVVERALLMAEGDVVEADHLMLDGLALGDEPRDGDISGTFEALPLKLDDARQQVLDALEQHQIRRALEVSEGSISQAANLLGVSRTTLWNKMRRLQIE